MSVFSEAKGIRKTILLIHSEPHIRDSIDIVLSYLGWKVLTARSPREGLRCANEYQPDAIVFDLSTEGMNFFAFVKQLRCDPLTLNIPMVLIGYATKWMNFNILPFQELKILGALDYPNDLHQLKAELAFILKWEDLDDNCLYDCMPMTA